MGDKFRLLPPRLEQNPSRERLLTVCGLAWSSGDRGVMVEVGMAPRVAPGASLQDSPQTPPSKLVEGTLMSKDWNSRGGGRLSASSFQDDDLLDPERRTGLHLVSFEVSRMLPTYLIYPHDTPEK